MSGWLIFLGYWCLISISISLAAIYSVVRTRQKRREERAANHEGVFIA